MKKAIAILFSVLFAGNAFALKADLVTIIYSENTGGKIKPVPG